MLRREDWGWAAALVAGLGLRALFVWMHPRFVGDTLVYGDLAHNMLAHHRYGLTEDGNVRSTLIRLPGYPLFLALCFVLFGTGNYLAVVWVQVFVDLMGCLLLGVLARRVFGGRVGLVCVWMAALCPFSANYAAAALTETLSIFCVVMGLCAFVRWMDGGGLRWAAVVGLASCGAVLLRPDGVLFAGVLLPAMGWVAWRGVGRGEKQVPFGNDNKKSDDRGEQQVLFGNDSRKSGDESRGRRLWQGLIVASGLLLGCLGLWAVRNWRVYHVVQPLAPKYANDPGEAAPLGFARWYRTWGVGLGDTARVYWVYDGSVMSLEDLPPRAFDSAVQRVETARVYAEYNAESSSTPRIEMEFARLAEERVRAHRVRFYVGLPLARLGDMWLRPRTELLPKMPLDWWRVSVRPKAAMFGWMYGGLNLALLGCAVVGLARWWRAGWGEYGVLAAAMVGFVSLRSGMLMTIDNSEPRYVLECYPVVILLAAVAVAGRRGSTGA